MPILTDAIMDTLLTFFIDRVHGPYFSNFPIHQTLQGEYVGKFMKHEIASRFRTLNPSRALAELACTSPAGLEINLEDLQRMCRASQSAVILDRFIRSIHLLNLMRQPTRWDTVFLPVSMGLIDGVGQDHGLVFRTILNSLELLRPKIGIVLPDTLLRCPERFAEVAESYRQNGFLIAVHDQKQGIREDLPCMAA